MPDVIIKRQFLYKRLPALFILTGETCLKNPIFCNFAFFGIKKSEGYPKKLKMITGFAKNRKLIYN
jgi:hypothetical protein